MRQLAAHRARSTGGFFCRTGAPLKVVADCLKELGIWYVYLGSAKDLSGPINEIIDECPDATIGRLLLHARGVLNVFSGSNVAVKHDAARTTISMINDMLNLGEITADDPTGKAAFKRFMVKFYANNSKMEMVQIRAQAKHLNKRVLVLTTIHKAQGGEWDWVFGLEFDHTRLPQVLELGGELAEDEEHALYTLITRAIDTLVCCPLAYYSNEEEGVDVDALRAQFIKAETPPPEPQPPPPQPQEVGPEPPLEQMAILGLTEWPTTQAAIRSAANKLIKTHHPDHGGDATAAAARLEAIWAARAALLNLV